MSPNMQKLKYASQARQSFRISFKEKKDFPINKALLLVTEKQRSENLVNQFNT